MSWRIAIFCATLVLASGASFGDVTTQPANDFDETSVFGVCAKAPHDPDRLADVGVKWLRVDINFTPTVSLDENLRWFDGLLRLAESRKMLVLPILHPREFLFRYRPGGGGGTMQAMESLGMGNVATTTTSSPSEPSLMDWGRWVHAVVSRYKGRVRCWEIANEPDLATSPQQYVAIAKLTYLMAKDADPACAVGAFSTAGINMGFIEACLKMKLAGCFDFVTVHPYQWSHQYDPLLMIAQLQSLRTLLQSYHADVPIWMTEFGWPSHPQGGVTIQRQADLLGQLFLTCAALEQYKCFWYCSGDWPAPPSDQEGYFGLFYGDDRRKPAADMLQTAARTLAGARGLGRHNAGLPITVVAWDYQLACGRHATAIWSSIKTHKSYQLILADSVGDSATIIRPQAEPKSIAIIRHHVTLDISATPTIIVYASSAAPTRRPRPVIATTQAAPASAFIAACSVDAISPGSEFDLPFSIVNVGAESIQVVPSLTLPSGMSVTQSPTTLTVASMSECVGAFRVRCSPAVKIARHTALLSMSKGGAIPVTIEVLPPIRIEVEPITAMSADNTATLRIHLTNTGRVPQTGQLRATLSAGTIAPASDIDIALGAGQSIAVERTMRLTDLAAPLTIRFSGAINGVELAISRNVQSTQILRPSKPIVVDGQLNDWPVGIDYRLNTAEQIQPAKAWWGNADELSASFRFAYDDENLYLAASVVDDVFFQPATDGATWLGDSIQWTIGDSYGEEFVIARTASGPELYRLHAAGEGKVGRIDGARLAIAVEGQTTRYELALPWSAIPSVAHGPGQTIRINFIVNDNDGAGRLGYLECQPGIGQSKTMDHAPAWMLQR